MRPPLLIALVLALVVTNALWAYRWVDRAVTLDHQSSELARQKQIASLLASLMVQLPEGVGIERTADFVRAKYPDRVVKIDGQKLEIDEVILEFEGERIARVTTM